MTLGQQSFALHTLSGSISYLGDPEAETCLEPLSLSFLIDF